MVLWSVQIEPWILRIGPWIPWITFHTIRAPSRWSWASTHEALDHHHHERLAGTLLHESQVSAGHVLWLVPEGHWLVRRQVDHHHHEQPVQILHRRHICHGRSAKVGSRCYLDMTSPTDVVLQRPTLSDFDLCPLIH